MKITINNYDNCYSYRYNVNEWDCTQKEYDYMFKYLDFDKLDKTKSYLFTNDKKERKLFEKRYKVFNCWLYLCLITNDNGEIRDNWGKGMFKIVIYYKNKQELKSIINKVVNIELMKYNK